jgi:prepilin-type N-terminal cleavage/methylation domain-containing protein
MDLKSLFSNNINLQLPIFSASRYKNKGFTLAEVLITLVVIGVIAAITLPTLIANYKKQEATAKIKKFYSTMQQVSTRAKADGNDWLDWADTATNIQETTIATTKSFASRYVLPYMIYTNVRYSTLNTYIYLNDGTYFWLFKGGCIDFIYDINGAKKPNATGRDQFRFLYCPYSEKVWTASAKIIPYQRKTITTREEAMQYCKDNANYCSALLAFDGWEFKSDYPYKI